MARAAAIAGASGGQGPTAGAATVLPHIREDLQLHAGPRSVDGALQWLVHDPVLNRFVMIGRTAYVLFQLLAEYRSAPDVITAAWSRFGVAIDDRQLSDFVQFVHNHSLARDPPEGGWRYFAGIAQKKHRNLGSRLLHNYLFFRIPVFHAERFLRATLPLARPLGGSAFAACISLLGVLGLYLVSREWQLFSSMFVDLFSLQGVLQVSVALLAIKVLHELGHAYVATAYGARVPIIGIAIMLGAPMLYSDVTDAWRLASRKARLRIDLAGVTVELAVACIATFAWAFLPTGTAKSIAFALATAGWAMSVAINLNPFARFDGYHAASDFFGIPNLQSRAFAFGCWRLREILFGLNAPAPELLAPRVQISLSIYAWATWIYRLGLFLGIAVAVYHYFFKLAGVGLFLVEIIYFVAGPVWKELKVWCKLRHRIVETRRSVVTAGFALMALLAAAVPWSTHVAIPAVIEANDVTQIYTSMPARIAHVDGKLGQRVSAGDRLITLVAPEIDKEIDLAQLKQALVRLRLERRTADDIDREDTVVLQQEMAALGHRLAGLERQRAELSIVSPFAGYIVETDPSLRPGRWVNLKSAMMVLRAGNGTVAKGYLDESALGRIDEGFAGRFVPDDPSLPSITATVATIGYAGVEFIDRVELASVHGGMIAAAADQQQRLVPASGQYPVRATLDRDLPPAYLSQTRRGILVVDGRAESFFARFWRQALKVLVRESGV